MKIEGLRYVKSVRVAFILLLTLISFIDLSAQGSFSVHSQPVIGKPRLLVFSGSDWCLPCIRFDREVLQSPDFMSFSDGKLNLEVLDFPQHKKLSKEEVEYNEQMAEKYNPNGYFPWVLLVDASGNKLAQIQTAKTTPQQVIAQIEPYLSNNTLQEFSTSLLLMGSSFRITIVAEQDKGKKYLDECVGRIKEIESWLSSWKETSVTSKLNREAGERPVEVTDEYYTLVKRCLGISELTQGAFDISFNGLGDLYTFDKQEHDLPGTDQLAQQLQHVGYHKIELMSGNRIHFADQGLRIGFGAIGKGYAAEQVKQLMLGKGITGGVINASGDLTTWGTKANGEPWKVGVPDPEDKSNILLWLPIENKAIATSGDYEKYFLHNGQRYSHIINPRTGKPVIGSRSVSIISDSAELSDALATAVSVLGLEVGMDLVNQLDGVECVFIDINRKLHFSNGLKTYAY